jgi:hypothetical protein
MVRALLGGGEKLERITTFRERRMKWCRSVVLFRTASAGVALGVFAACSDPTDPRGTPPTLPPASSATVLFIDDFDAENGGVGINNWESFRQWEVVAGCVDLHGNGFYDVQPGKGLYVDLDGTCRRAGTIQTKDAFELTPGDYVLEFWIAGNHRIDDPDTVDVSLGSLHQERLILSRRDRFALQTRAIRVEQTTSARIRFQAHGGDNQGALLDLVRLRRAE